MTAEGERAALLRALSEVTLAIRSNQTTGMSVVAVNNGPGTMSAVKISVVGNGEGPTIGMVVGAGPQTLQNSAEAEILRDLANAIDGLGMEESTPKPWLEGILQRIGELGNRALDSAVSGASAAAAAYYAAGGA
jgi:hypothetical protein